MKTIETLFNGHLWVLYALIALGVTALIQFITASIINKLLRGVRKKQLLYPEALLEALKMPLVLTIWLIGLSAALLISLPEAVDYLLPIKQTGLILLLTWALVRFIRTAERLTIRKHKKREKLDATMIHAISLLLTITTIVIGGLAIMQLFGLPISGLLAFGGIGGAAIAFASKDLLANFFGGLVVYLDKPFKVGDWIRSPDKEIQGTVEHIGWRVTCIRTFDKRALYVPNSYFLTISVENSSRMLNRRIKTIVGVRYDDASKINKITKAIQKLLEAHPGIDTDLSIQVCLTEFGASSLDILIDAFSKTTQINEFRTLRHEIFMKVLDIIASNGAECAFPTQTIYLEHAEN